MATLRLFAGARQAAGTASDTFVEGTVGEILAAAVDRYGARFAEILPNCRVWLNGDETEPGASAGEGDELAVLPPVSGG